jgi:hypothetical protein
VSSRRSPLPNPGTHVIDALGTRRRHGVVMPYDEQYSDGAFPVRFEDQVWRRRRANEVTVLSPPGGAS